MRRIARVGSAVALLVVVGAGGLWWLAGSGAGPAGAGDPDDAAATGDSATDRATAEVRRETLVVTETYAGTLRYVGTWTVVGGLPGTLTATAPEGTLIGAGDRLYETDGSNRASLMIGEKPAWRAMGDGVTDGPDIAQLEANLAALGYTRAGDAVDDHWDDDTTAAVVRWQKDRRLRADGELELGEIVFLPGPIRVTEIAASLGSVVGPGAAILHATSTTRLVTLDVGADDLDGFVVGEPVEVELPDGSTVPGTIASVGNVARVDQATGATTFEIGIGLDDPTAGGDLVEAPVDVRVVSSTREDVQTVPVNALLALREGGYAVEVVDGSSTRLVRVEPGLFDAGRVEITADGLADGTRVVVPS